MKRYARQPGVLGRTRGRAVVIAVALASVALVVPQAVATPPADAWTQEQIDARYQQYRGRINQLLDQGKTQPEVDLAIAQEFDIVRINIDDPQVAAPELFVPEVDVDAITAATTASQVVMYTPTFSYDNLLHKYVMAASWGWKQCAEYKRACWTNDRTGPGPVGGPDGMALKINRPIFRYNAGISTNDNCGNPAINNNQADTDTGYGIGFIEQDVINYSSANGMCVGTPYRYNWHRGTVSETFLFQGNCDGYKIQVDSKIGHTWSSTAVDSITIQGGTSSAGIGFRWSSTNHRWNAIPASPDYGYC
jgi:hypothetical protein